MDAERTTQITFTVSVSDDDLRTDTQLAKAILSAIRLGRDMTMMETTMDGVKVSAPTESATTREP